MAVKKLLGALLTAFLLTGCVAPAQLNSEGRVYEVSLAYIGGRPALAWHGGALQHEALFMRYASATGRPQGPVLRLTDATRDAYEASLQDVGGDALVAWYEQEGDSRSGGVRRQVALLSRFDANGRPRWQRQLSANDVKGRLPVVRVRGDVIHVAWIEERDGADSTIRVAGLNAAGEWLQQPIDAALAGRDTWNLNAAVGADGTFHVLYDSSKDSTAKELHWLRVQHGRIEDRRVSTDDGRESAYPDIALEGTRAAITWFDSRDGNEEVYLRCVQLDASGAAPANLRLDDDAHRITHTPDDSIGAYVAWHEGGIELAWTQVHGERRRLMLQRFDRDCRAVGEARQLAGARGAAGIASLASSNTGFAVAWDEQRHDTRTLHGHSRRITFVALLRTWPHGTTR
jgi:hypothetical protein